MKFFDEIIKMQNIRAAYLDVKESFYNPLTQQYALGKLSRGVDGVSFTMFERYLQKNLRRIQDELINLKTPFPTLDFKIPKSSNPNKFRVISVSSLKEKVKHQAICRVIEPRLEELYADNLYSYRKGRGSYQAVKQLRKKIVLSGDRYYLYKVDMSDYFDTLDHEILLDIADKYFDDLDLRKLIELFLKQRRIDGNEIVKSDKGVVQGMSISSHLANLYLMDLDLDMESKGVNYLRVGDDIIVAHKEKDELLKIADEIEKFLVEERMLVINKDKTVLLEPDKYCEYMGYELCSDGIRIAERNYKKMKNKIRLLFNKRISEHIDRTEVDREELLNEIVDLLFPGNRIPDHVSWLRYFLLSNDHSQLRKMDDYIENRIRLVFFGKIRNKNKQLLPVDVLRRSGYISLSKIYFDITRGRKSFLEYRKIFLKNSKN